MFKLGMSSLAKISSIFFMLVILNGAMYFSGGSQIDLEKTVMHSDFSVTEYTNRSQIIIGTNSDFETQGWPGNGTEINPYRIENLRIVGHDPAVLILGTDVFFIVRNCIIASNESGYSLDLNGVENGVFEDCLFQSPYSSIEMDWCSEITFENCSVQDSQYYYNILDCSNCDEISMSNCSFEGYVGIVQCSNWYVHNNTMLEGLTATACQNLTISNNILGEDGLSLFGTGPAPSQVPEYYNHTITGNIVNEKPLLYLKNSSQTIFSAQSYGQIILFDCSVIQIAGGIIDRVRQSILIAYSSDCSVLNVETFNANYAIVGICSQNLRIENCLMGYMYTVGIICDGCEDVIITRCNVLAYHTPQGIIIDESENVSIYNNDIDDCSHYGIGVGYSSHVIIDDNTMTNCRQGIVFYSDNGTITNNFIYQSNICGLYLIGSNCTARGNEIVESDNYGIRVDGNGSVITKNRIVDGKGIGVFVDVNAGNNRFYDNSIGCNLEENAHDNGTANEWDDGISEGNRWSDYSGTGVYSITGTAGSVDHFPIVLDEIAPVIYSVADFAIPVENGSFVFSWTVLEDNPSRYEIYQNGSLVESSSWSGGSITYEFIFDETGTYNITIVVFDVCGNQGTGTTMVEVVLHKSSTEANSNIIFILFVLIGVAGTSVIIIVIVIQKRR